MTRSKHRGMACVAAAVLWGAPAWAQSAAGPAEPTSDPAEEPTAAEDEAAPAAAEEDPALEPARDAFRLGSTLARQGQWTDALAAFERSESLRSHPVTQYNIGYVERALGHFTRARKYLRRSLGATGDATLPEDLRREASSYLREIERKLARAVVTLESGTAVAVEGRPLERSQGASARPLLVAGTAEPGPGLDPGVGSFDLLVDPGAHVFVLSCAGLPDTVVNEMFAAGSTRALELGCRSAVAAPTAAPASAEPAPGDVGGDTGVSPSGPSVPTLMWIAYGVGAAGIATGSVFGILAIDKKAYLDENGCVDRTCPPELKGDIDVMDAYALVSTIGFGAGVAGAAVGTYFLLTSASEADAASTRGVVARAYVRPGSVGVTGAF